MNGQWMGPFEGSNNGVLVVNLDDMGTHFEGHAVAYDGDPSLPDSFCRIVTPDQSANVRLRIPVSPINPTTRAPVDWTELSQSYPDTDFSRWADIEFQHTDNKLHIQWKTDLGYIGSATLTKSRADQPSAYQPRSDVNSWREFKQYVNDLRPRRRHIFRGQSRTRRLRTLYHRSGRADLLRFVSEDIPALHRHLSSRTPHVFNLSDADQNGAFFNLVQHHGYPTPLLDWTFSPYVAAFFAYRKSRQSDAGKSSLNEKVRIFVFDHTQWRQDVGHQWMLTNVKPHFTVAEFIALNNERLVPQQSISTFTNIDDIESYITEKETELRQRYLDVIDLPAGDRQAVFDELSVMGITAGSLFPGLDGACEELRERMFAK